MPFTIQSNDLAGVPARQSVWYTTDIAILVAGEAGTGVLTGCEVTAQGSPDMTLAVASGTIQPSAGVGAVTVTAGNVAIGTAHATLPRIDLVTASAAGVKTVTAGTASAEPKPPDLPSGHIGLAMVDVPAADTAIQTAQITSKRVVVFAAGAGGLSDQGIITYLDSTVAVAPGTPASGALRIYAKTGKVLAVKDDAGAETILGAAGGATITTQEEGGTLSTTVTTIDFVGAGVTASGAGATTTVTIPGGGGAGTPADAAASLITAYSLFR
jgi:hypothetical protein